MTRGVTARFITMRSSVEAVRNDCRSLLIDQALWHAPLHQIFSSFPAGQSGAWRVPPDYPIEQVA